MTLRALLLLSLLPLSAGADSHAETSAPDLFELPLEELLMLSVSENAVRDLDLSRTTGIENPFSFAWRRLPFSLESIDANTTRARNISNVVEATENMLGVLSGESPSEPYSFSIRGFTRDSISVLYDGISIGASSFNMRPQAAFLLDRIELVRGATALHGTEGGAGGALNMITRSARFSDKDVKEFYIDMAEFGGQRMGYAHHTRLSDELAFFAGINRNTSDGWVENSASYTNNAITHTKWRVSADWQIGFSLNYLDDELPAYWGTPLLPRAAARDPESDVVLTNDDRVIDGDTRFINYNVADHTIESTSLWSTISSQLKLNDQWHNESKFFHFTADRYWQNAESYNYDNATGQIGRDRLLVEHDRKVIGGNSYFHFFQPISHLNHHLAIGLEYTRNEFSRIVGFDPNNPNPYVDYVNIFDPDAGLFGPVDHRYDAITTQNAALVFENSISLSRWLDFFAHFRHESIDILRERYNFSGVLQPLRSMDRTFYLNAYRLGFTTQVQDGLSVYAHHSRQHDPLEGDFSRRGSLVGFEASPVQQNEIGMKWSPDSGLFESTLSVFEIEKLIIVNQISPDGLNTRQYSDGYEFALTLQAAEDIRVGINYTDIRPHYGHAYDPEYDVIVSDNIPINAPDKLYNIWFSKTNILGAGIDAGLGYHYVGKRFANTVNTVQLNDYDLVHAFISYQISDWRIAFNVRNLNDRIYAPWSDSAYPNQVLLGQPRTFSLSANLAF